MCCRWTRDAAELFSTPVPADAVAAVLALAEDHGLLVQYYVGDAIHVACRSEEHTALTRRYAELTGVAAHVHVGSYDEAIASGPPPKLLVMGDAADENLALLQAALPPGLAKLIRGTPPWFVEVLHPDVQKGAGLRRMCAALRVPLDRVVAFGDGDNDVEFLQAAGVGYAMLNGRPTAKAVADRVSVASHDDDGVVASLEEMEARGELAVCAPRVVLAAAARGGESAADAAAGAGVRVERVSASRVAALRERVLWPGRPEMCRLPEDESEGAVHLAAVLAGGEADEEGPEIVGVLSLFLPGAEGEGRAQFRKLAVDEAWRRRGLGAALVDVAAAECRAAAARGGAQRPATALFCHAREAQAMWYEKRGFRRVGEPFQKYGLGGEAYVEMEVGV